MTSRTLHAAASVAALSGLLLACVTAHHARVVAPAEGAVIVAFVRPPENSEAPSEGHLSAVGHLVSALQETAACLEISGDRVRLVETEEVTAEFQGDEYVFRVSPESGVGAALLSTGAPPREVAAPAGASSLVYLLPNAAAEYFDAPACKRDV